MKHIRLMVVAFAAALALSVVAVASAVGATAPDLLRSNGEPIPAGTPITASGTNPILKGKGSELKCASVETVEGGTHGNTGIVIGTSEKEFSIKLLISGCEEAATKSVCTSEGAEAGHILTVLLLVRLVSKKVGTKLVGGDIVTGPKGGLTEELAKFKCGEKTVTATGCVPGTLETTEESKMLTGVSEKEYEIKAGEVCEEKSFGTKSEQIGTVTLSFNTSAKLLALLLVV